LARLSLENADHATAFEIRAGTGMARTGHLYRSLKNDPIR
jgi:hypothetical protein